MEFMKLTFLAALLVAGASVFSLPGQGTFQNLDFESAQLLFIGNSQAVATTNALPGWTAFAGSDQLSVIAYNVFSIVHPVELIGSNALHLNGNFSVFLTQAGLPFPGLGTISQTGLVPSDAQSLLFKAAMDPSAILVALGGENLLYIALSSGPNYTLYGADIGRFAGRAVQLTFSAVVSRGGMIDDIEFSSQPIPEPSAGILVVLAAWSLALHQQRRERGRIKQESGDLGRT
jgi:hypothetical protein